jgi:uncharacterized protein YndB with AHSA1/START domain
MTIGTSGIRDVPFCNRWVAHATLRATVELQEAPLSTVRREIVLPVERERAWALLTETRELEEWLADDVVLEPEEGAPLRVAWAGGEEREGVVEEVEEQRRLRFRWDDDATGVPSRVEWTLDDAPGGTRVVVEERPLVPLELRALPIAWRPRAVFAATALAHAAALAYA